MKRLNVKELRHALAMLASGSENFPLASDAECDAVAGWIISRIKRLCGK